MAYLEGNERSTKKKTTTTTTTTTKPSEPPRQSPRAVEYNAQNPKPTPAPAPPPPQPAPTGGGSTKKNAATLAAEYGFSKAFFGSDPELSKLLARAVAEQWEIAEFQAAFMDTKWYRTREASVRQWIELETRDPKEAQAKIKARAAEFADSLSQLGVSLDQAKINDLAKQSLLFAWNQTQITDILATYVKYTPGEMAGTPAALEMQINKLLGDYGITATTKQMGDWIVGTISGRYTEDNLRDFFRDSAKSRYPGMASYLDQGMTVRDIASPYVQSYAQLLEVAPDTVNLRESLIQSALQGAPPQAGQPPQMQSLYEFERGVRRDPRWLQTRNARNDLMNATQGILRDWGLVG